MSRSCIVLEGGRGANGLCTALETFSFWLAVTDVGVESRTEQIRFTPEYSCVVVSGFAWEVEDSDSLLGRQGREMMACFMGES